MQRLILMCQPFHTPETNPIERVWQPCKFGLALAIAQRPGGVAAARAVTVSNNDPSGEWVGASF
ncbi:MAG: hypothetical protein H7Z11_19990 [Verrucomicrobia bacterium]|nr:hypothetical protein [Leptolyngbya sp. ES-bin-22]